MHGVRTPPLKKKKTQDRWSTVNHSIAPIIIIIIIIIIITSHMQTFPAPGYILQSNAVISSSKGPNILRPYKLVSL